MPTIAFHMRFSFDRSLAKFELDRESLLRTLQDKTTIPLDGLASGAVIFRPLEPVPQVLLIQRAPTDSMPLKWEVPGGAVNKGEDAMLGASREVGEETGLIVGRMDALIAHEGGADDELDGGYIFRTTRGKTIIKFTFAAQLESHRDPVRLDPKEHVDYVWATEEECRHEEAMESPPPSSDLDFAEFFDPSKPLQGIVVCCTSIPAHERTDLGNKVAELGGRHEYDLTPKTTHLVVGEYETTKYRHVAKQRPDIRPMAIGWIDAVRNLWVRDDPIEFKALENQWALKTFETRGEIPQDADDEDGPGNKLKCCVSGLLEEERSEIIAKIKANGGKYTGNLDKSCTHLIVREPTGKKYSAARRWGQHIVTKKWVEDSIERGMILDEACYDPHLPEEEIGKGAWVKRDVRRKSLGKRLREAAEGQEGGGRRKLRKTASMKLNSQRDNMWGEILGQQPSLDQSAASLPAEVPTQPLPGDSMLRQPSASISRAGVVKDSIGGVDEGVDDVFASCSFYIYEFPPAHVDVIVPFITSRGGEVVASLGELRPVKGVRRCFVVVPQQSDPKTHPPLLDGVDVITEFFIEKCVYKKGTTLPDPRAHVIGRPFPVFPLGGFDQLSIATSGFLDIELNQVEKVVRQLGARYEERFTAQCSVLVCTSLAGARRQKLQLALSWGVSIVKAEWLWDCITRGQKLATDDYLFPELKSRATDRSRLSKPFNRSKSVSDMPKKNTSQPLTSRTVSLARNTLAGPDMSAFDTTPLVATEPPRPGSHADNLVKNSNLTSEFETAPTHQPEEDMDTQHLPPLPESRRGSHALVEKSANDLNKNSIRERPPSQPSRKPLARIRSEVCDSEAGDDDELDTPYGDTEGTASEYTTVQKSVEVGKCRIEQEKAEKAAAEHQALSNRLTSLLAGTATNAGGSSLEGSVQSISAESAAAAPLPARRRRKIIGRVISNASVVSNGSEGSSTGARGPMGRTHSVVLHEDDSPGEEEPAAAGPTATQLQYDDPEATRNKQRLMSRMLGQRGSPDAGMRVVEACVVVD
ncbi:hypothetical protein M406DRAFT_336230 [Cryphonectria parasitica EP155]|uniref:Uncharacterized protein n=1 Tax=Cryphonectria parasitica (strain ATCC 38755 / EP155) TaxID=660469 RepID=A0A9P4YCP9_CRYP1|nr:uncharacterized protein M406DRAFT_336230 [Cryphonectria parasitica EP155]KAF3770579.1 hypothetical protein M406DRAFT_336230 [Cryphonectria parasitica EP155]